MLEVDQAFVCPFGRKHFGKVLRKGGEDTSVSRERLPVNREGDVTVQSLLQQSEERAANVLP